MPNGDEGTTTAVAPADWGPTEDGLAQAFLAGHGDELRYCPSAGRWLRWAQYRWVWDEADLHWQYVLKLARQLPRSGRWRRFHGKALSASGVAGVARLARTSPSVTVSLDELDAHPYELNTPSGIVDLRTGSVRPADRMQLHTRSTAVGPDADRRGEVFERFLDDTFGDDAEMRTYVQRLVGVAAIGTVLEQVLPFAHGDGADGKSTLFGAVMHALGIGSTGYAIAASSDLLIQRPHADHPTELAQLAGARLVVCSELDEGQRFAESRIKLLTGGDLIPARFIRGDWFTFRPSHTLILLGNHRPEARSGGPGLWRRLRLLPFAHTVPEERQDPHLPERLREEAPAILAWIVQGAVAYLRDGPGEPESIRAATAAYAREQDSVARFVGDCCEVAVERPAVHVATGELRTAYERWCAENDETPTTPKVLTQRLHRLGVISSRGAKGVRRYEGIALRAEPPQQPSRHSGDPMF
ncbi:phage/plasmid primase, P4 family [Dactylosporangium sp. NPDC050688]|uniref:DNA primase family protein n=1 Tax=Dactylosporangium sp. NPDC050688 TaxID=3157217 RepID=UPI0033F88BD7